MPDTNPSPPDDAGACLRRVEKFKRCFELCGVINSSLDLDKVLELIMSTSRQALGAETCSLLLVDESEGPGKGDLVFEVTQGPVQGKLQPGFRLKPGQGVAGWVSQSGKPLLIEDAYSDGRFNPEVDRQTGYTTKSILCVPLAAKGRGIGVAQLINKFNGEAFNASDLEMFTLIGAQAAVAIDNARMHREMLVKQRMEFDMELAASIQQGFIPKGPPILPGVDMAGRGASCDETGGDYFDFITFPPDAAARSVRAGVAIGDVTGHGIPAALLMASVRAYLRARMLSPGGVAAIINDVNRLLSADLGMTGRFMTMFFLEVDASTRTFRWVRAGHDPAIVYDPETDCFDELGGKGIPLGVEGDWDYAESVLEGVRNGMVFVLGTDGIWEARNPAGEMYGKDRIRDLVRRYSTQSAMRIADAVICDLETFMCGLPQRDDVTLVVVKTTGFENEGETK